MTRLLISVGVVGVLSGCAGLFQTAQYHDIDAMIGSSTCIESSFRRDGGQYLYSKGGTSHHHHIHNNIHIKQNNTAAVIYDENNSMVYVFDRSGRNNTCVTFAIEMAIEDRKQLAIYSSITSGKVFLANKDMVYELEGESYTQHTDPLSIATTTSNKDHIDNTSEMVFDSCDYLNNLTGTQLYDDIVDSFDAIVGSDGYDVFGKRGQYIDMCYSKDSHTAVVLIPRLDTKGWCVSRRHTGDDLLYQCTVGYNIYQLDLQDEHIIPQRATYVRAPLIQKGEIYGQLQPFSGSMLLFRQQTNWLGNFYSFGKRNGDYIYVYGGASDAGCRVEDTYKYYYNTNVVIYESTCSACITNEERYKKCFGDWK